MIEAISKFTDIAGELTVFYRFPLPGGEYRDETLFTEKNTVVNSAADILAKAVAGQLTLNGMYFPFTNGLVSEPPVPVERTADHYHTLGSISPKGFVRAPTLAEPSFRSTDTSKFNNNQIILVAISDTNVVVPDPGNELIDGVSQFYGSALLALDPDSFLQDILFSADNFVSPVPKIPNAQIGVRWRVTFKAPAAVSSSSSMFSSSSSSLSSLSSSSSA